MIDDETEEFSSTKEVLWSRITDLDLVDSISISISISIWEFRCSR